MKRAIYWLLMPVSGLCVLPTLVGLVDAWAWLMLGYQISGIEWQIESGRVGIASVILAGIRLMPLTRNGIRRPTVQYEPTRRPSIVPLMRWCVPASIGQAYGPPDRRNTVRKTSVGQVPPVRRSRRLRQSGASEHPDDQMRHAPGPEVDQPVNDRH